ncbi:hypothetical protein A2U01_0098250, partial [Trifolium medium]|nr:hypothetical protein [Trifolium medium]
RYSNGDLEKRLKDEQDGAAKLKDVLEEANTERAAIKQSLRAKDANLLDIKMEMATSYLEGFDFAVAQAKVAIPSEH